jgi:hypothetical protein
MLIGSMTLCAASALAGPSAAAPVTAATANAPRRRLRKAESM